MRDKAVDEVAGLLFPRASTVILTSPAQPRAISAPVLAEMTSHHAAKVEVIPDPEKAFERALELASPEDVIFVTGSLYLVGDLRRYWLSRATAGNQFPQALPCFILGGLLFSFSFKAFNGTMLFAASWVVPVGNYGTGSVSRR